jgi:hypothetical protein
MTVTYISRSEWEIEVLERKGYAVNPIQFKGLAIHHTVTSSGTDRESVCAHMRRLQRERPDLGLDVPYSWVVFRADNPGDCFVAEGRGPGRTGAHTYGANSSVYGVSVVGNFVNETPSPGILEGIRYVGRTFLPWASQPTKGHQDFYDNQTACPGTNLEARLGELQPPFYSAPGIVTPPPIEESVFTSMAYQAVDENGTVWIVNPPFKLALTDDGLRNDYELRGWIKPGIAKVHPWTLNQLVEVRPNSFVK